MATALLAHASARHSRRSACDRCRAYKLRCQRSEQPGQSCERCSKAQLVCTTTFGQRSQQASPIPVTTQPQQEIPPITGGAALRELLPAPTNEDGFAIGLPQEQQQQQSGSIFSRCQSLSNGSSPGQNQYPGHCSLGTGPCRGSGVTEKDTPSQGDGMTMDPSQSFGGMDFIVSDMQLDANSLDMFIAGSQPSRTTQPAQQSTNNGNQSNGASPFLFGQLNPSATIGMDGGIGADTFIWDNLLPQSSPVDGTAGGTDSDSHGHRNAERGQPSPSHDGVGHSDMHHRDSNSDTSHTDSSSKSKPSYGYADILRLSLEIYEDQQKLETAAPLSTHLGAPHKCTSKQQFQYINRMLDQGSRFWEILQAMAGERQGQQKTARQEYDTGADSDESGIETNGSSADGQNRDGQHTDGRGLLPTPNVAGPDHLLVVQLTLTYVYLVRSCRAVFVRLLQALEATPAAESLSLLRLPSMRFGEFQLENNLAIQVKLLVELMSAMLLRIGDSLGISPVGILVASGNSQTSPSTAATNGAEGAEAGLRGSESRPGGAALPQTASAKLACMREPDAVVVRESILSSERAQEQARKGVPGQPPALLTLIQDMRRLMERRYSLF